MMGGWSVRLYGDCEYHVSTVAGGRVIGYVTQNDVGEWVAATGDVHAGKVIGSGYASPFAAKRDVNEAAQ